MGAILEAMRANRTVKDGGVSYRLNLYSQASQMIVITDAPAKDVLLLKNVTKQVTDTGVKVHFILASEDIGSYYPYQSIASINQGLVLTSAFEISKVIQTLTTFASHLTGIKPIINATLLNQDYHKRSAENCYSIDASLYTSHISAFFMKNMSLTYPNGTTTQIAGPNTFTVRSPDAGRWAMCSAGQMYYNTETVVHYAVTFVDSKFSISENPPFACKFILALRLCIL